VQSVKSLVKKNAWLGKRSCGNTVSVECPLEKMRRNICPAKLHPRGPETERKTGNIESLPKRTMGACSLQQETPGADTLTRKFTASRMRGEGRADCKKAQERQGKDGRRLKLLPVWMGGQRPKVDFVTSRIGARSKGAGEGMRSNIGKLKASAKAQCWGGTHVNTRHLPGSQRKEQIKKEEILKEKSL